MYSFNLQDMFSSTSTNLLKDKEATESNLILLLKSFKGQLLGDPYFGTNLKKFIYEQSTSILVDLVIDDIVVAINTFMPQLMTNRNKIKVTTDGVDVFINIECLNKLDNTPDLYIINLTSEG